VFRSVKVYAHKGRRDADKSGFCAKEPFRSGRDDQRETVSGCRVPERRGSGLGFFAPVRRAKGGIEMANAVDPA